MPTRPGPQAPGRAARSCCTGGACADAAADPRARRGGRGAAPGSRAAPSGRPRPEVAGRDPHRRHAAAAPGGASRPPVPARAGRSAWPAPARPPAPRHRQRRPAPPGSGRSVVPACPSAAPRSSMPRRPPSAPLLRQPLLLGGEPGGLLGSRRLGEPLGLGELGACRGELLAFGLETGRLGEARFLCPADLGREVLLLLLQARRLGCALPGLLRQPLLLRRQPGRLREAGLLRQPRLLRQTGRLGGDPRRVVEPGLLGLAGLLLQPRLVGREPRRFGGELLGRRVTGCLGGAVLRGVAEGGLGDPCLLGESRLLGAALLALDASALVVGARPVPRRERSRWRAARRPAAPAMP